MAHNLRILIVGGVAGGASCAARARRLSESAEIIMFDRGPYVSFANCGLPYYVGDVIKKEENLLIATPELFRKRFNIDVRLRSEVVGIDRIKRCITVKELESGETRIEPYDALVLSPGARPIRPDLAGIDLPGIFSLRTIPDSRQIRQWIDQYQAHRALVVGGGYIGMEMTDNLLKRGLKVTVVEKQAQVMPIVDPEMIADVHAALIEAGVSLFLNDSVVSFEKSVGHTLGVTLASGQQIETDMVILCIGVRPEVRLAVDAGLAVGDVGGIRVDPTNAHQRSTYMGSRGCCGSTRCGHSDQGRHPLGRSSQPSRDALPPMSFWGASDRSAAFRAPRWWVSSIS